MTPAYRFAGAASRFSPGGRGCPDAGLDWVRVSTAAKAALQKETLHIAGFLLTQEWHRESFSWAIDLHKTNGHFRSLKTM